MRAFCARKTFLSQRIAAQACPTLICSQQIRGRFGSPPGTNQNPTVAVKYGGISPDPKLEGERMQANFHRAMEDMVPPQCRTEVGEAVGVGPLPPAGGISTEPIARSPEKGDEDTHPDFQPKPIGLAEKRPDGEGDDPETANIKKDIEDTIASEDIVVFIKGLPEAPVCGFSKATIDILDALGLEYTSFDVLAHPVVRAHVKEVSGWPTIPQLFIKGQFFGGQDVVQQLAQSGMLSKKLEDLGIAHKQVRFLG